MSINKKSHIFLLFLIVLIQLASVWAQSSDERLPSTFQVGDEILLLPEVFSVLDFGSNGTFPHDDDIKGQMELRNSRYWGRLYIEGWPQTIQYFRAHFGLPPPMGRKQFVFAEPRDACTPLLNADILTEDHIVLANRGVCTFGSKSKIVAETKAGGIIIVNNEPGLTHLPGPDAYEIKLPVSSIPQPEGRLLEAVYDDVPNFADVQAGKEFGRKLEGYMIPINCDDASSSCLAATLEERHIIGNLTDGGFISIHAPAGGSNVDNKKMEYLLGYFGIKTLDPSQQVPLSLAKPADACSPLENDVSGKVVLVRRGGCTFVKKAEEIMNAGGRAMVVGSSHPYLIRMGVEPRWKGLNTVIPLMMVSKASYSALVAETYQGSSVSFHEDKEVNSQSWQVLESLNNGEGWPRSEVYVQKKYEEWKSQYSSWPDRLEALEAAYNNKMGIKTSPNKEDSNGNAGIQLKFKREEL